MSGAAGAAPGAVAVVVCAYTLDRWDDLCEAIASALAEPAADEVLVVIDHNDELAERAGSRWRDAPRVRVTHNARTRGLSGARNTAIATATADVLVFLDDDAAGRPGWLPALLQHFADPRVLAVGGAAHPVWPAGVAPGFLPAELWWVVGCTYAGQPVDVAEVRNVMGCNMAFRREVFDRVGGFDEAVGRIGTTPLGCEETELCIRLRAQQPDARIVFEPASVVRHHVSADRTTWRYLWRRAWAEGLSKATIARSVGADDALSAERAYTRSVLPRALWRGMRDALTGDRAGLAASGAIVAAVTAAGTGYVRASFQRPDRAAARAAAARTETVAA